jgi:uncharacterized membrane protein
MLSTTSGSRGLHPSGSSQHKGSFIAAVLLAVIYLLTSVLIASHRLFWYDEIFTVTISQLPDCSTIWKALAHASDAMPPTYYMLVRIFDQLPIPREVAARLPSALAMVAGMLITFDCARRLSDGVYGLIAFSVLSCSALPYYGYEARPYALYFMFASLALWIWIHASDAGKLSSFLFGIVIFFAVAVHYYAILCLVPYAVWEVSNRKPWRAPSGKLTAGCLGVLCAAALFSRQILALRQVFSPYFWSRPAPSSLAAILNDYFNYGLFPLAAIMIWVALVGPREKGAVASAMRPSEQLGWFFGLIPVAGYILAKLGTNAFSPRYYIALLPGIAVAFSCLLWRQFGSTLRISIPVFLLFATLGLGVQFVLVRHPDLVRPPTAKLEPERVNAMLILENRMPTSAKQFIVLPASDLLGVEARYYSKHPEKYVFLVELRSNNSVSWNSRTAMNLGQYSPMLFWTLDDLKAHVRETALVDPSQEAIAAVEQSGYKMRITGRIDGGLEVVSVE